MQFKGRTALVALVAVFALGALAAASASAALPEFSPKSESFPIKLENELHSGGTALESSSTGTWFTCGSNRVTGEITGAKTVPLTLEWTNCSLSGTSFWSKGSPHGDVSVSGSGTLVYIDKANEYQTGILLTLNETTIYGGKGETVEGELVLRGKVVIPIKPINTEITGGSPYGPVLTIHAKSGKQEYTTYENEKGESQSALLEVQFGKSDFLAGMEIEGTNTLTANDSFTVNASVHYLSDFGESGTGEGQLDEPSDVAVAPNGDLWVLNNKSDRIEEFTASGKFVRQCGTPPREGAGEGTGEQLEAPRSLAVDSHGNVWVADTGSAKVKEFSEECKFVREFGSNGGGNGQFHVILGVAVDSHGNVWTSEFEGGRIQEFNEKGEFLKVAATLVRPADLAFSPAGNVYITEEDSSTVVELNEKGEVVRKFGSAGEGNGQFGIRGIYGIAVDGAGRVWVPDPTKSRVEGFTETGEYLTQFGTGGSAAGEFGFGSSLQPVGITADSSGDIWVADAGNERIDHWAY